MEGVFAIVLFVVAGLAVVFAIYSLRGFGGSYSEIGKGGLSLDEPDHIPGPMPGTPAAAAEADAEIRQMLEAKSARRERRGEAPLDIDAEVEALMAPAPAAAFEADPALREEVRQMVVASNERRERRGEDPLDVEAEVARKLQQYGGR